VPHSALNEGIVDVKKLALTKAAAIHIAIGLSNPTEHRKDGQRKNKKSCDFVEDDDRFAGRSDALV